MSKSLTSRILEAQQEQRLWHADVTVFAHGCVAVERDIVVRQPDGRHYISVLSGEYIRAEDVKEDHPATQNEAVSAIWHKHLKEY